MGHARKHFLTAKVLRSSGRKQVCVALESADGPGVVDAMDAVWVGWDGPPNAAPASQIASDAGGLGEGASFASVFQA